MRKAIITRIRRAPGRRLRTSDAAYPQEGEQDGEYEGQYADAEGHRYDEYEYADDGAYEDDELGGKRRNSIKFALALLGVVVFGSAAAFGYRTIFRGGTDGPPPLIRADTSPTKIVPTSSTADASSKPINDRLGNGSGERMVSREEQPVDLRDAARNANGGLVAPLSGGAAVAPYPTARRRLVPRRPPPRLRPSRSGSAPSPSTPTPRHRPHRLRQHWRHRQHRLRPARRLPARLPRRRSLLRQASRLRRWR